jgi:NTP pyrophosphatase (non-canonical NTP hydrolase)
MINALCKQASQTALIKGFHEHSPVFGSNSRDARHILSWLMLVTTEVAEAAEEVRRGESIQKFTSELADICIRTFDIAGQLDLNLEEAILAKMDGNKTRPFMHGDKLA